MTIFSREFWRAASERAVKSAAQGAILAGVGAVGFDALDANWQTIGGATLGALILSLLTSIGSDALTGSGPSLTNAETTARTVAVTAPEDAPTTVRADVQFRGQSGERGERGAIDPLYALVVVLVAVLLVVVLARLL